MFHDRATPRETIRQKRFFAKAKLAERTYATQLRKLARHIGDIIRQFTPGDPDAVAEINRILSDYSRAITPWSRAVGRRMLVDVSRRDARAWAETARSMGRALKQEIETAPTGILLQRRLEEQVHLITSLPLDAAQRVHKLTLEAQSNGSRAKEIAKEILRSGDVSVSRANLIARTEVARTASDLTQVRAEYVGSEGYIWRTAMDSDVRKSHREMEGKFIRWDDPPTLSDGTTTHAGRIYNCFPGSTKVSLQQGCHKVWRSRFTGKLVRVGLADGSFFEATPNHPILTERGWVPVALLDEGSHLVQDPLQAKLVVEGDVHDWMPTFDEIFVAFGSVVGSQHVQAASVFDFHDRVPDHNVDEIWANHLLAPHGETTLLQCARDLILAYSNSRVAGRELLEVGVSDSASLGYLRPTTLGGEFGQLDPVGLAAPPDLHSWHAVQDGPDGVWVTPVLLGQGRTPEALRVVLQDGLDRVLTKVTRSLELEAAFEQTAMERAVLEAERRSRFTDGSAFPYKTLRVVEKFERDVDALHVFTMQTNTGYYSIGNARVVAKNCRCHPEPVIPENIT